MNSNGTKQSRRSWVLGALASLVSGAVVGKGITVLESRVRKARRQSPVDRMRKLRPGDLVSLGDVLGHPDLDRLHQGLDVKEGAPSSGFRTYEPTGYQLQFTLREPWVTVHAVGNLDDRGLWYRVVGVGREEPQRG